MSKFINGVTNYEEWRDHSRDEGNRKFMGRMAIINSLLDKQRRGEELTMSDYIQLVSCINVGDPLKATGKMENFPMISTSCMMNKTCQGRACLSPKMVDGFECWPVCKFCYSPKSMMRSPQLIQSTETNTLILTNFLIPEEAWAALSISVVMPKVRIEGHGEANNVVQARNYIRIMNSHKWLTFTVFSHNDYFHYQALTAEGGIKPSNMIYNHSSLYVNIRDEPIAEMAPYTDHVFTVFDKVFALAHGIRINCGEYTEDLVKLDHKCKNCMKCYIFGTEYYINEMLK